MHFVHEHDVQLELEVLQYAVKHSIHIEEATENAMCIPENSQYVEYVDAERLQAATDPTLLQGPEMQEVGVDQQP